MSTGKRNLLGAPIMGIVGATKYYGPVEALKAVSLNIRRGQVHAVVGENGAGKSTLIGIAAGAVPPDFAVIRVGGKEIKRPNTKKLHRAGVAVTFQHPELAEEMTVIENIQLAAPRLTGARPGRGGAAAGRGRIRTARHVARRAGARPDAGAVPHHRDRRCDRIETQGAVPRRADRAVPAGRHRQVLRS